MYGKINKEFSEEEKNIEVEMVKIFVGLLRLSQNIEKRVEKVSEEVFGEILKEMIITMDLIFMEVLAAGLEDFEKELEKVLAKELEKIPSIIVIKTVDKEQLSLCIRCIAFDNSGKLVFNIGIIY